MRQVLEVLGEQRPIGYTTVLKMLQIMRDKELVRCDARKEPHVFRHRHQPHTILRKLAGDLLERAFDGSAARTAPARARSQEGVSGRTRRAPPS